MCGSFGVAGAPDAAQLVYLGLYALQHRGQESAGLGSSEADGTIPMDPVSIEASSERISPNMLPQSMTSNWLGSLMS